MTAPRKPPQEPSRAQDEAQDQASAPGPPRTPPGKLPETPPDAPPIAAADRAPGHAFEAEGGSPDRDGAPSPGAWGLPGGLALRFAILLAAALLAANLIAAALLQADRTRQMRASLIEREIERIVSLVPALEAAAPGARATAASAASTRVSRVTVAAMPIVEHEPRAPRSAMLTRRLSETLAPREVRAAILLRPWRAGSGDGSDGRRRGGETVALSIRLNASGASGADGADGAGGAQWLNSVSRGSGRSPPGLPGGVLVLVFGLSLGAVLAVSLVFLRRLTRPLSALTEAARRAGRGDRGARVAETGPPEFRAAAAAFNEMQARIARFDADRMRTLAAVGHDLRTPLTSLRIRAEMLPAADAEPMVRTLDEMAVMAAGLIEYAQGGGAADPARSLDLGALIGPLCDERGAAFHAGGPVRARVRPVALGRAVGNLVDNAIRYGGGARVSLVSEGAEARIHVDDDGPGIPPDQLAAMFEPFVRGEASRSVETGGTGLGLAIARAIAREHGGTITLANRQEGGLRATLGLPLAG